MQILKRTRFSYFFLLILISISTPSFSSTIYDQLSESQKKALQRGDQVLVSEDVGKTWPKVTIFQKIDSTPEEAMAIMIDYELHSSIFKNISKSKIAKQLNKTTTYVDYTLDLPWPLPNENYTLKDQLSLQNGGNTYALNWSMIRADSSKDIQGGVRFESQGTSTLMAYQNLVVPSSGLAGLLKGQAVQAVKDAAQALSDQIDKEKSQAGDLLQKQIATLRAALDSSRR